MSAHPQSPPRQLDLPGFEQARDHWEKTYREQLGEAKSVRNRSGLEVQPLYTREDWNAEAYLRELGFPGQLPMTRGIYPTMHRGRLWTQRQLIGLGVPAQYNQRLRTILNAGATAVSLIPCNSVYRGYDIDEVDPLLLGTCGVTVNTIEDMDRCLADIDIGAISISQNDPSPFTLLALMLGVAKRRGVPFESVRGTSNQSDYISHYVANHMFFRLALPGARRVLLDHIAYCNQQVPQWNAVSVVGQHMQQSGATPAQAMAFTICTAIQYAEDCIVRGMAPDDFLPRFTFFFDISISFFEEIAKFRAGRRIWQRIVRERFGAKDPRSWRFKFHAQTSGVDLTRQQPLNNIARTTVQALAGIFGGLQSLHTDAYDEVLSTPTEEAAKIAIATQNILREEAHATDVIDPLGGSFYLERLTNEMEELIINIIADIDDHGGMYQAVDSGYVQTVIGEHAQQFQQRIDSGEEKIIGVNCYRESEEDIQHQGLARPDPKAIEEQLAVLKRFKERRSQSGVQKALDQLARAAHSEDDNIFARVVDATLAEVTHGEICTCLRRELGFGQPLVLP